MVTDTEFIVGLELFRGWSWNGGRHGSKHNKVRKKRKEGYRRQEKIRKRIKRSLTKGRLSEEERKTAKTPRIDT
jgi:hypothetical protein